MPDTIPQRLAEIRERCKSSCGQNSAQLALSAITDVPYLLALVERLVEFVPVPQLMGDDMMKIGGELIFGVGWYEGGEPERQLPQRYLTACEVHGIDAPDWLRQRASGTGGT